MANIIIIGAGQLGSRHLQALHLIHIKLNITVVDTNLESLKTARLRFENSAENTLHTVTYLQEIPSNGIFDIAIIASTASHRRQIIESLLSTSTVKHLLLEKLLFTQHQDYFYVAERLASQQTKTWVNCSMRMMPFYQHMDKRFQGKAIQYRVSGSQYGLLTNAIHYLDHIAYLTGCTQFSIDTGFLDQHIIKSKREGYYEFTGSLMAKFDNNSVAVLQCNKEGQSPKIVEIYNNDHHVICRELEEKAWKASAENDWTWQEVDAPIPFQSSLTADFVTSILKNDMSTLPDYTTSMNIHLQFLKPLKDFLNQQGFSSQMDYPFT